MTVEQYAAKFIELSCFGPHLILTEVKKASRFQKGLNERLRYHLIASGVDNYAESVKRAIRLEEDFKSNVRNENHLETLDIQAFDKAMLKVIGTRKDLLGGLGIIHQQISQKIRIHPRMLKIEVRMLALHVEDFMEISRVSLKERLVIDRKSVV